MSQMDLRVPPGRTYRYYTGRIVFPFGWGLSLAEPSIAFKPGLPAAPIISTEGTGEGATFEIAVSNGATAIVAASQVVTVFWSPPVALASEIPSKSTLCGFERVGVAPGATETIKFVLEASAFATADVTSGDLVVFPGNYSISFTSGDGVALSAHVVLRGERIVLERFPRR